MQISGRRPEPENWVLIAISLNRASHSVCMGLCLITSGDKPLLVVYYVFYKYNCIYSQKHWVTCFWMGSSFKDFLFSCQSFLASDPLNLLKEAWTQFSQFSLFHHCSIQRSSSSTFNTILAVKTTHKHSHQGAVSTCARSSQQPSHDAQTAVRSQGALIGHLSLDRQVIEFKLANF